jgi:DNA-binding transcriptional MerR regulator
MMGCVREKLQTLLVGGNSFSRDIAERVAAECGCNMRGVLKALCDLYRSERFQVKVDESDKWWVAEIASVFREEGMARKEIACYLNLSGTTVREYINTYRAFPAAGDRVYDLSWTMYLIAAQQEDPHRWLKMAVENGWTSEELKAFASQGKPEKVKERRELKRRVRELEEKVAQLELKISHYENECVIFTKEEFEELQAKLSYYENDCFIITKEQAALLPTLVQLRELYEQADELKRLRKKYEVLKRIARMEAGYRHGDKEAHAYVQ